jgi:trehalose-phosphatase
MEDIDMPSTSHERSFKAVILDLDGVITKTAHLHAEAWKQMFDEYLEERSGRTGEEYEPLDIDADYRRYIDGKPRYDGVRSFLESRGIELPEGAVEDPPDAETVYGLGNRKNEFFQERLQTEGAETYPDAVDQIDQWRHVGMKLAVITSSRNGSAILESAGLLDRFEVKIDGNDAADIGIKGKPAPDIFLEAANRLGVTPEESIVVEDANSGVQAGRAGGFGLVVGVDRDEGNAHEELYEHGADLVVTDLREVTAGRPQVPSSAVFDDLDQIFDRLGDRTLVLLLDYDGTLTPIVDRPEDAVLSDDMRSLLELLAELTTVAIVSGRDLADVRDKVGLADLYYAGSHGFDIEGPDDVRTQQEGAVERLPELDGAEEALKDQLADFKGVQVERKRFAIAIHYRLADEQEIDQIEEIVDSVRADHKGLRKRGGKKIFELQPDIAWDKGRAVRWLLDELEFVDAGAVPIYIGDDETDEDAFETLSGDGIGIRVGSKDEPTGADFLLDEVDDVKRFFAELVRRLSDEDQGDGETGSSRVGTDLHGLGSAGTRSSRSALRPW